MRELTRAVLEAILGSTEEFSAEEIKKQLAVRQENAAKLLKRFRKAQGISVK